MTKKHLIIGIFILLAILIIWKMFFKKFSLYAKSYTNGRPYVCIMDSKGEDCTLFSLAENQTKITKSFGIYTADGELNSDRTKITVTLYGGLFPDGTTSILDTKTFDYK